MLLLAAVWGCQTAGTAASSTLATPVRDDRYDLIIEHGRVVDGSGNIVFSDDPEHVVALVGVRDCVVVHTADVTITFASEDPTKKPGRRGGRGGDRWR